MFKIYLNIYKNIFHKLYSHFLINNFYLKCLKECKMSKSDQLIEHFIKSFLNLTLKRFIFQIHKVNSTMFTLNYELELLNF